MSERIVDPALLTSSSEESTAELALRPKSLDEFVGQHRVREQLSVLLTAAKSRGASAAVSYTHLTLPTILRV